MKTKAPYGTWPSPISASLVANNSVRRGELRFFAEDLYWLESRPQQAGRNVLVRMRPDGRIEDVLPTPFSARSKVHEYGGGAYTVHKDTVYFVEASDQQIYALDLIDGHVRPLTRLPDARFADLQFAPQVGMLLAVCEEHGSETLPETRLVAINLIDQAQQPVRTVAQGQDFFASPTLSPCGRWLAYLSWNHPQMPWDHNRLWLCSVATDGTFGEAVCLTGNGSESLFQPRFAPDGALFWASDRSNWWNLYRLDEQSLLARYRGEHQNIEPEAICPMEAEFAVPQWTFGQSTYAFLDADTVLATYTRNGFWHLAELHKRVDSRSNWNFSTITTPYSSFHSLTTGTGRAALIAAGAEQTSTVCVLENRVLHPVDMQALPVETAYISHAEPLEFLTSDGEPCHAFFYRPVNAGYLAPDDGKPPVIALCHGGPTGATDASFNYKIQFWTSRGFAVLDVNYRGSTGFGRSYRHALLGRWGELDVRDVAEAVEFVTAQGWVHPQQRIIRGSSAGGLTVLAALTDTQVFNAGVSLYGIGDLEALARDTHKFEAFYLEGLVGPYPARRDIYIQRSPLYKVGNISCPVLIFQGLQDKVVPPNQAEAIVAAVRGQGLPVAYVSYPDEAHGFRKAETIDHQLAAELYFYQRIFGLGGNDTLKPVIPIENFY